MLKLRADAVASRVVDGELVGLDLRSSTYFAVNTSGVDLWASLVDGATREHLVGELGDRFALAPAQAATDVDAFLDALRAQNLLETDAAE
jgi:hypothetical protein